MFRGVYSGSGRWRRRRARRKLAPAFGLEPDEVADIPHAFVGSVEEICDDLERRRDRWGLSYFVIQVDGLDAFAPVVAKMAGS